MFTGIIQYVGKVKEKSNTGLKIFTSEKLINQISKGNSVSVNGVCLTVTKLKKPGIFWADVMPETWKKTMLSRVQVESSVNLELPVTPQRFLSGHIVQGHVEGLGVIEKIIPSGNSKILKISIPKAIYKYIASKGSVAVNGVSLTVITSRLEYFTVGIIPHTWQETSFFSTKVGDRVNIETDVLAKYVEKILKLGLTRLPPAVRRSRT